MENTRMTKAQRMVENMMVSMAIQEVINQKAIHPSPEMKKAMDQMIALLAENIKPAEA